MRQILFLITALNFCVYGVNAQGLQFYREDINFRISKKYFTVEGFYYFYNTSSDTGRLLLHYPFPAQKDYGKIDSVEVIALPELTIVPSSLNTEGMTFPLKLNPYYAKKYKIKYRQRLRSNKAEYILVTTQQWRRPLEQVNYTLTHQPDIVIDSASYPPDTSYQKENTCYHSWHKRGFVPQKNLNFYFHKRNSR